MDRCFGAVGWGSVFVLPVGFTLFVMLIYTINNNISITKIVTFIIIYLFQSTQYSVAGDHEIGKDRQMDRNIYRNTIKNVHTKVKHTLKASAIYIL